MNGTTTTTTTTGHSVTHVPGRGRTTGHDARDVREVREVREVVDVRDPDGIGRRLLEADRADGVDRADRADRPDEVAQGHCRQVVMVVEIHDSHRRQPGVDEAWIETFGTAAVDINDVIGAFGGQTIAVLGTRVVASFGITRLADVFDAAVTINRRAALATDTGGGWLCSIGVATGEVIDASSASPLGHLGVPLVGSIVDRALVLCSWAQAGAVLADERSVLPSVGTAADTAVRSEGPAGSSWTLGPSRSLVAANGEQIEFRDVAFDRKGPSDLPSAARLGTARTAPQASVGVIPDPPGVRNSRRAGPSTTSTSTSTTRAPARTTTRSAEPQARSSGLVTRDDIVTGRRTWSVGHVCCWFSDKGRGVVASVTGQEFYVDRRFLVAGAELDDTASVYFVPRDPMARGRNPVAGVVLVEGSRLEVRVAHVDERGFGFAEVGDSLGTRQLLLVDLTTPAVASTGVGDWLLVEVVGLQHGPVALPVA